MVGTETDLAVVVRVKQLCRRHQDVLDAKIEDSVVSQIEVERCVEEERIGLRIGVVAGKAVITEFAFQRLQGPHRGIGVDEDIFAAFTEEAKALVGKRIEFDRVDTGIGSIKIQQLVGAERDKAVAVGIEEGLGGGEDIVLGKVGDAVMSARPSFRNKEGVVRVTISSPSARFSMRPGSAAAQPARRTPPASIFIRVSANAPSVHRCR